MSETLKKLVKRGIREFRAYTADLKRAQDVAFRNEEVSRLRRKGLQSLSGLSLLDVQQMATQQAATDFARKNHWYIEVQGQRKFIMWATDVEYNIGTLRGERRVFGGVSIDNVQGHEPIEMRITCMDDAQGTIKSWFRDAMNKCAHKDGTVGVPGAYGLKIKVVHGSVRNTNDGFFTSKLYRPVSVESSLSRREGGLEELQMTFTELETQL